MSQTAKNILSDEEIKENLVTIYNGVKSKKVTYEQMKQKYGISNFAIMALKNMTLEEFERLLVRIPDIKADIQEGIKTNRRISADIGCGVDIIAYIAKSTCENYKNGNVKNKEVIDAFRKKVERMWKQYKTGETIVNLSYQYGMEELEIEFLLNNFEDFVKNKREYQRLQKNTIRDEKKNRLKRNFKLDDDTIAYIVDGKEIGTEKNDVEVERSEQ